MSHHPSSRCGVTLIEIMVALILVSTVLLVSLTASANLLRNTAQRRAAIDAEGLAGQILDEISAQDFEDRATPQFGLEPGETASDRTTYDDVDDYHGYVSDPPTHRDGTKMAGFDGWTFSVSVKPAAPVANGILTSDDDTQPLRQITVVCSAPDGSNKSVSTIVSSVPSDISDATSFERLRRLTLRFPDRELTVTVPLRNAPDAY
jgi:prepilin-type N-terminal cleavage/methylation domain-containing protein